MNLILLKLEGHLVIIQLFFFFFKLDLLFLNRPYELKQLKTWVCFILF